jgi:predicted aconitase with swiveling domain
MITQPSAPRILEVLRQALTDTVLPAVTDPVAIAAVQMVQQVLGTLAIRAEHEIAWLVEETDSLEALGAAIVATHPASARVAAALDESRGSTTGSLLLSEVSARYTRASEILSCAVEEVPLDSDRRADVEAALDARLAHELQVIGDFQLVGRT